MTATANAYTAATRTAGNFIAKGYDTSPDWDSYAAGFGGQFDCTFAWMYECSDAERAAFDGIDDFRAAVSFMIEKHR